MTQKPAVVIQSGSTYVIWFVGALGLLGLPIVGTAFWAYDLIVDGLWLPGLIIFGFMYTVLMLGMTVGVHRYLSHRSFEACQPIKVLLCVVASMSQGPVLAWAANHRRHHQLADRDGDFHSPHRFAGDSFGVGIKNLFNAHYGWIFRRDLASYDKYLKDWLQDPAVVRIDELRSVWAVMAFALPALLGFACSGTAEGFWDGFRWGCLSLFCVQNATFSINSVCHLLGKRRYRSNDRSTNNVLIGIAGFGEGWHNNHHCFPYSARFGIDRGQIDVGYWFIALLEKTGLIWNVKGGPDQSARAKRLTRSV